MRSVLLTSMLALMAGVAVAQDWGNMAVISSTLGNNTRRFCIGDHARPGDIGCPTWAPSLTTAGDVSVTGNLSANKFIGDGSGLTNISGASADRIVSGTTSMLAISNTGYVSLTQSGVNTGWFDPSRGLVTIGVSSTGPISASSIYAGNFGAAGSMLFRDANGVITGTSSLWYNTQNSALSAFQYVASDNSGYKWGDGGGKITGAGGAGYIALTTSGTEAMRIVSSGYVGIGTSQPSVTLHVLGGAILAKANSPLYYQNDVGIGQINGANTPNLYLQTIGNSSWVYTRFAAQRYAASYDFDRADSNSYGNVNLMRVSGASFASTTFALYPQGASITSASAIVSTPYVALNEGASSYINTNKLGVGTITPTTALEVSGTISASTINLPTGSVNTYGWIGGNSAYNRYQPSDNGARSGIATASHMYINIDSNNDESTANFVIAKGSQNFGGGAELLRLTEGGKMGLGTVTPSTELEVSGTISATNLVVNGVSITGNTASADRIVSGSINAIADVSTGSVRVSGTLALNNTGNEPCDAAHYYTFRANPITQQLEMCRP